MSMHSYHMHVLKAAGLSLQEEDEHQQCEETTASRMLLSPASMAPKYTKSAIQQRHNHDSVRHLLMTVRLAVTC